jgi:hypothetical protein
LAPKTDLNLRIRAQVLEPVGGLVFRDHVETAVALGKPDFNLARTARFTAASGEIQILLAIDLTGP